MSRMKTFLIYALLLIGFIIFSYIIENGYLYSMYKTMSGTINGGYLDSAFKTELINAKASNVSGFITLKVKNTSGNTVDRFYTKVDLYSKLGLLSGTKYYEVSNFRQNEERTFDIRFNANEITNYDIAFLENAPDKSHILNILGWEIDLTNVFGMDLSKHLNLDNLKQTGSNVWTWAVTFLNSVPTWAYLIAGGIVFWYLPKRYLFGIFPF